MIYLKNNMTKNKTNLSEHEKLKAICDKIGYDEYEIYYAKKDWMWFLSDWYYRELDNWLQELINIREIIFTEEFMDKFEANCFNLSGKYWESALIRWNLNNPVDYLYSLIFE